MNLQTWDPNSLFQPFFSTRRASNVGVFPLVNVYDNGDAFLIRAEVPGMSKDAFDISVKDNQLTIRGERIREEITETANLHRRERTFGEFRRVITIPEPVDSEKIVATYEGGVLQIVTPRKEEVKPRKINIVQ